MDDEAKPSRSRLSGSGFVRRLIPTVAAAALTFTGCLSHSPGDNNGGNNGGSSDADVGGSDSGPEDTGMDVRDSGPTDTGPADSGTRDSGAADTDAGGSFPIAQVNGDGELTRDEIESACRGFESCDPSYFGTSYGSVAECTQYTYNSFQAYLDEALQQYGAECAQVQESFYECLLSINMCDNGQISYDDADYDNCYAAFPYYMYCSPG